MFHVGASSEPILCSRPGVLLQRQDRAAPDKPSAWDSNASIFAVATLCCVSEFGASLPSVGTSSSSMVASAPLSLAHLYVSRSGCDGGVSTLSHHKPCLSFLSPPDSLVRPCQHKHNTIPYQHRINGYRFVVSVSVVCYSPSEIVSRHSLLTHRHQQTACPGLLSRLRFPTALSRYPSSHSETSTHAPQPQKSDRSTTRLGHITHT